MKNTTEYKLSTEQELKSENYFLRTANDNLRVALHKAQEEVNFSNKRLFYFTSAPKNIQTFNDMSYSIQLNNNLSATQVELLAYMFQEKEDVIERLKHSERVLEGKLDTLKKKIDDNKKTYLKEGEEQKTYLIKNGRNNLYKIGRSKNPLNREKTLQSEEPLIKIVKLWDKNIERKLHKEYNQYRVRGEWFKLSKVQVKYICTNY